MKQKSFPNYGLNFIIKMLFKFFRSSFPVLRRFGEVNVSKPLAKITEADFPDKVALDLDFSGVPQHTSGNYNEKMQDIFVKYVNSLKAVTGGRYNRAFFDNITVYTWMEHVPLPTAANVEQLSETSFMVRSYDSSNGPTIEVALKKSPFNLSVVRDMGDLTVTMKLDKEASKASAGKLLDEAKVKIGDVAEAAAKRFGEKNKAATAEVEELSKRVIGDMELFHKQKVTQISN